MKVVKLDEAIENLERVKDAQPVIDLITADAIEASNKISSKTVLEKVREIVGEEAFLGAKNQPLPKKVKVPEPLSLDESLFNEASDDDRYKNFSAADLAWAKKHAPQGDNNDEYEEAELIDPEDLRGDELGQYNAAFAKETKGSSKLTGNSWLDNIIVMTVYHACVNPGGMSYVPSDMVHKLLEDVAKLRKPDNKVLACGMMRRWHILSVPQIEGRTGCFAPGENIIDYVTGKFNSTFANNERDRINTELDNRLNAGNHDWYMYSEKPITTVIAREQLMDYTDPQVQDNLVINTATGMTLRNYLDEVQIYMDNIPAGAKGKELNGVANANTVGPLVSKSGNANNTNNTNAGTSTSSSTGASGGTSSGAGSSVPSGNSFDPNGTGSAGTIEPIEPINQVQNASMSWADDLDDDEGNLDDEDEAENESLDMSSSSPVYRKKSALLPPGRAEREAMELYARDRQINEDLSNMYVISDRYFDLPTVKRLCAIHNYSPLAFCYDVFGDESLYTQHGGKFDGTELGDFYDED